MPGGKTTRNKRRSKRRNDNSTQVSGLVVSRPFTQSMTANSPGHASIRTTFNVLSDTFHKAFNMNATEGFPSWAPKLSGLLDSYEYWRLRRVRVTYVVTGGAASTYYIIGNVSNSSITYDNSVVGILDDDYAGVANGVVPLVLEPQPDYWNQGVGTWLSTDVDGALQVLTAGILTYVGGGGDLTTTLVGWCSVDMDVEFHTMS